MPDFSALTLANNVKHARKLIDACEHDLGRELSAGECRDLLTDNTHWARAAIADAVAVIKPEGYAAP